MSYQKDRDEFVAVIRDELPNTASLREALDLARLILRNAATIQNAEEMACSSEAADRDRVPCPSKPGAVDCLCRDCGSYANGRHGSVPRIQIQILRASQRIEAACNPWGIKPKFNGDPRGACVKLILPSGRYNSWGGKEDGYCVPTR